MGIGKSKLAWTAWNLEHVPEPVNPRMIVVGRSNVGKSTLLNLLTHPQSHFRKGSRAGLTIGLICVTIEAGKNRHLDIVDTPGWGYAERPNQDKERWVSLLESLRPNNELPRMWVLLVDPLRDPKDEEISFLNWLEGEAFALVFTKSDKVGKKERAAREKVWRHFIESCAYQPLWISAHSQEGLKEWLALARGAII